MLSKLPTSPGESVFREKIVNPTKFSPTHSSVFGGRNIFRAGKMVAAVSQVE